MFSKILFKEKSMRLPADFTVEKYLDALKRISLESRFYLHRNTRKFYLLEDLTFFSDIDARKKQQ